MNYEHHNSNPQTGNELICTVCSPKTTREQLANNSNQPMESDCSLSFSEELFTEFSPEIPRGEEVCVLKNSKMRKNKKGHPFGWPFDFSKDLRSSRRFGLRGFFCFRRR